MRSHESKNIIEEDGFVIEEHKTLWDSSDRSDHSIICRLIGQRGGAWTLYYFNNHDETIRLDVKAIEAALNRFPDMPEKIKFFLWSLI